MLSSSVFDLDFNNKENLDPFTGCVPTHDAKRADWPEELRQRPRVPLGELPLEFFIFHDDDGEEAALAEAESCENAAAPTSTPKPIVLVDKENQVPRSKSMSKKKKTKKQQPQQQQQPAQLLDSLLPADSSDADFAAPKVQPDRISILRRPVFGTAQPANRMI